MTIWKPELPDDGTPKYKALATAISQAIQNGELLPGEKLPTHRHLADTLKVTVGTVTRGYAEAEKQFLIESRVGSGTFVRSQSGTAEFQVLENLDPTVIDMSYSYALDLDQNLYLSQELAQISQDPVLMKRLLNYQPESGMEHQKIAGKNWMEMTGIQTSESSRIVITNGGQHGFYSATQAICNSGDSVLSAGLTYPGFSSIAKQMQLKHIGLDFDDEGVLPESLSLACQRYAPRVLYLNTRLNNPSCEIMSQQRINQLADILRTHQVWVIEDDVQGCMQADNTNCFTNLHPDITVFITSTSKALAGGLRVGYVLCPPSLLRGISNVVKGNCWMAAPLMVEVVSRWIINGEAKAIIDKQKQELKVRHQIVKTELSNHNLRAVEHGFNVWLTLPPPWTTLEFVEVLKRHNVLVKPAQPFAANGYLVPEAIRFCVGGNLTRNQLKRAVSIINKELSMPGAALDFSH